MPKTRELQLSKHEVMKEPGFQCLSKYVRVGDIFIEDLWIDMALGVFSLFVYFLYILI